MENEKEKKELAKVEAKETAQVVTTGGNAQLEKLDGHRPIQPHGQSFGYAV